jgi:DNA-binding NarL/FixJ family response regulator
MRSLLESQENWRICGEADNGHTAIEKAKQLRPDLVILDIMMPALNGFGAARVIKEFCPGTAILLYSAYHSEAFANEARRMCVDGYVSKSESRQEILKAIGEVQRRINDDSLSHHPDAGTSEKAGDLRHGRG